MSKFKKSALIAIIGVVIAAAILMVLSKTGNNPVANVINTIFSPVQTAVVTISRPIKNFAQYISEMKDFKEENERLKSELATLKKEARNQEEYKKENTRLKKLLDLSDELTNCETVAAKIVAHEPQNWFYSLMINKGSKDGIKVSDVVITESGLVGKISEVGLNWARVSTVLDSSNAVGVKLTRTGDSGIAEGDSELLKKRRFKLDYILRQTSVINGDMLETSGLGGVYPPGLSVGRIEEIEFNNTGELVKAIIQPAVDFQDLYEVLVVTRWEMSRYDKDEVMQEIEEEEKNNEPPQTTLVPIADDAEENISDEQIESQTLETDEESGVEEE